MLTYLISILSRIVWYEREFDYLLTIHFRKFLLEATEEASLAYNKAVCLFQICCVTVGRAFSLVGLA